MFRLSQITFESTGNAVAMLSDFLLGLGSLGVAEDIRDNGRFEISAYFPMESDLSLVMKSLAEYCSFLRETVEGAEIGPPRAEHIDRSSWEVWKTVLGKVRAGRRVVIVPPWETHNPENGEVVVEINPSLAFGTGHHETTRLCIASIERMVESGRAGSMLDVGCGSGILAISASKLGVANVAAFDTDPVAIRESRKNAEKNSVINDIKFFCGYIQSARGTYDLIVANVYLEPIYLMREELKSRLAPGGRLVVSGIPGTRRDEAVAGLERAGFNLDGESGEGGWAALELSAR